MYYAKDFSPSREGETVTDERLAQARTGGVLLGLPHPDDPTKFAYPRWQFHEAAREAVRAALVELSALPGWSRWTFFHASSLALRGLTPLQLLGLDVTGQGIDEITVQQIEAQFEGREQALLAAVHSHLVGEE